jgi:transposase-like protein
VAFKAKVALAAAQADRPLAELVEKYDVRSSQITQWKTQYVARSSASAYRKILRRPRTAGLVKGCSTPALRHSHDESRQRCRAGVGQAPREETAKPGRRVGDGYAAMGI